MLKNVSISELLEKKDDQNKLINIYGRTGKMLDPLPLFGNGYAVEVVVTGSDLWIDIESDCGFYEPWVAYELNGYVMGRQMLLPGEHSICLFRNMSPDIPKRVKFYRELQAMSEDDDCRVLVKGFKVNGEFMPVPEHTCKLEFIGDSITSGEGTYGAHDDMDWLSMYMSFSHTYEKTIVDAMNADYHIISQGGWGVYCGWDNDVRHNIPSVYEKVSGLSTGPNNEKMGTQEDYDFSSWQPDAIIVNLGTNDESAFKQPPFLNPDNGLTYFQRTNEDGSYNREDLSNVEKAVVDFLFTLRKNNPKAHIVWVYGMLGYNLTMGITEAINVYQTKTSDFNVGFINLPNTVGDGFGSRMHPGTKSHTISANILIDYLREHLA